MHDKERVTINGRHVSEETLVRLCGLVALPLVAGTAQNLAARRRSIHELARFVGVGVATQVAREEGETS